MEALALIVIGLMFIAYFAPTIAAISFDHKNIAPIVIINVLLGWTLIGWVVALAWAFKRD